MGPTASLPADVRSTLLCAERFDADGILRLRGRRLTEAHTEPLPSLFWAAGFSFSRRTLLQEVRLGQYDSHRNDVSAKTHNRKHNIAEKAIGA